MSILFVLLTFLIIIVINYYFHTPQPATAKLTVPVRVPAPVMSREAGLSIPQGYRFHPGHTWVLREGKDAARVGLDKFAADLVGNIDQIETIESGRWVRQGQRLLTLHSGKASVDLLSPVEGVVMEINGEVVRDPKLTVRDPYKNGWVAVLRSPDLLTNEKNLLQGPMVAPWMHYSISRLGAALAKMTTAPGMSPVLAQDGGVPLREALLSVEPSVRQKLIRDFFLN